MITLFIGPMKSGKTKLLIEKYYEKSKKESCAIVAPSKFKNRKKFFEEEDFTLQSRCGQSVKVTHWFDSGIIKQLSPNYSTVFVDEFSFLDKEQIITLFKNCSENNTDLELFSLEKDFSGNIFPNVLYAISIGIEIVRLLNNTLCEKCNMEFSEYDALDNNFIELFEKCDFINSRYVSLCKKCFETTL
jgi:thymidine kinase